MSLAKPTKKRRSLLSEPFMNQDPFFSDLFDTRRGIYNLNRILNGNFDEEFNFSPAVNIKDQEKNYIVEMAAPGLSKEDFEINIDDGILTVSAKKEEKKEVKKEDFVRKEFSYNSFTRSMSLPDSIDEDKDVKAQYKDGVLSLNLLKKEESVKPKKHKSIKVS
ncbi:Hsp20/alpha crystallin family protein [Salegentibacter chungangensis]|uniref:Hsp20/alpha crystallin family protein n=1 Tax=Salegentibacter chungangensis TaxID=1335724 RepID=A0ABW3NV71_9FLAO